MLEAELAGIRERARAEIASAGERVNTLAQRGAGPDKIYDQACIARDEIAAIERVAGLKRDGGDGG